LGSLNYLTGATGQTVVVTASSTPSLGSGSSGPSTAGIAAGVVVGIVAIAAIAGGVWFFMRARARREVEEEYKRQAAVNAFINGGKPGSSASSNSDSRLDPVIMTQRRMSDGSIADNQDYSRRILKV
jgi:cell wall integrity and stress response component